MLKKLACKKIIITTLSLLIISVLYFYNDNKEYNFKTNINYYDNEMLSIYLPHKNKYVARLDIVKQTNNKNNLLEYIIDTLTVKDNNDSNYLPTNFYQIIPKNTKLLNYEINNDLVKLNFSKEFNNIDITLEEKLIESIVYSVLEIDGIKNIMIFVEGEILYKLPKSGKILPTILNKKIGINKTYNIDNIKNSTKTTIYYLSEDNDEYYYVPITTVSNNDNEKIEIIIEKLKSVPSTNMNLMSFLNSNCELINYEVLDNSINLSFNNYLLNLNENEIKEEVKYSIALSIRDSYDINETIFYIDDNLIDHLNI